MPLDTIYLTRHGHRLNWTIDYKTGTYHSQFPTPTGNPADPTLTSHGVQQSHELAAHFTSDNVSPKPFRIYSSPFYRCLQTIQPTVEALKHQQASTTSSTTNNEPPAIDTHADLTVRTEPGLGEWFGPTTFFHHPTPAPLSILSTHFPTILPPSNNNEEQNTYYTPILHPSTRGETIAQLHDRVATTLSALITSVDEEISTIEASLPPDQRTSKAILICSHAAPLIAMGRALTGNMPGDSGVEDFKVYTAGVSTFVRRTVEKKDTRSGEVREGGSLAPGTEVVIDGGVEVPDWKGGKGVAGGWECVSNGDCTFLSGGAERGWHFDGDESFDTGPMAGPSATPTSSVDSSVEIDLGGSKL
ncbi:hypothetical protein AbraIFM66950_003775 [Aspergillus brasiliensis]|nr:hypothetical protein AbraIFM66950_003775 [Aspergillus brasiliensis]